MILFGQDLVFKFCIDFRYYENKVNDNIKIALKCKN